MARIGKEGKQSEARGYFEIGIYRGKAEVNIGTLLRSAYQLGASGVFIIGPRYKHQGSDTVKSFRHIPFREYEYFDEFYDNMPRAAQLVGIEMGGTPLSEVRQHPQQAIYLLGAEDNGLPELITMRCHRLISLESVRTPSFNVAVAGSIVMYDRVFKKV